MNHNIWDDLPANKSLNIIALLENGGNTKISPIIDLSNNSCNSF